MVIKYSVTHKHHTRPIEMCGIFRDLEHFSKFKKLEADRGWNVGEWEILAQKECDVDA